jgi:hypothetical protein
MMILVMVATANAQKLYYRHLMRRHVYQATAD